MNTTTHESLLTRKEAAHILGVSIATVKRWQHSGKLTAIVFNSRTVRYRTSEISRLVSESEVAS